jgi:hypothetical protein
LSTKKVVDRKQISFNPCNTVDPRDDVQNLSHN